MKTFLVFVAIMLLLMPGSPAYSADLESLAKEGYEVVEETRVVGEFKGCDAKTALALTNGSVFICSTYSYSFASYMPAAYILKNKVGDIKVLIQSNAYSGSFVKEQKPPY